MLVVDDDQAVCESASELLKDLGMRGDWVLSGGEAVVRITDARDKGEDYYFVILDWLMPGMDGLDTVRAIRKKLGSDVPIIIISAYDYSEIEEEFLLAGANAFIAKPLFKSRMPAPCTNSAGIPRQNRMFRRNLRGLRYPAGVSCW